MVNPITLVAPFVIWALTVLMAGLRIAGVNSPAYQAVAHLFVGGLFAAALLEWKPRFLRPAIVLSVTETVMFIITKLI